MSRATALPLAEAMRDALLPYCEPGRCIIAGSLRRQCELVGDIEIVAMPKMGSITPFFMAASKLAKPQNRMGRDSRYVKLLGEVQRIGQVQYDLFLPAAYDWGRILAIRTGSAEFAQKMLANQWVKKGYCGTEHGLLPQRVCRSHAGKWQLLPGIDPAQHRVVFHEEEDFFKWLDFALFPSPESRSLSL